MLLGFGRMGAIVKKRLILFMGVYDTLDLFMQIFQQTYEELGYEIMIFNTKSVSDSLLKLSKFAEQPIDAMITFNNLGISFEFDAGRNLWNDLKIPCINILVDHPFHYHDALLAAPENCTVLCIDENHVSYIKRFYPNIKQCSFLPHGGMASPQSFLWEKRTIDVMYAGGLSRDYIEPLIPKSEEVGNLDVQKVARDLLEFLIANPWYTTETAFENYLKQKGIVVSDEVLSYLIHKFRFVESLAVSHFREKTVESLVNKGIRIHLYGNGWQNCKWINAANVYYGQRVSPEEIMYKMGQSKIVLNTMTWFKSGCHERVFNAMLSGGVAMTDTSKYLDKTFSSGKEIVCFELSQINCLPDMVDHYLSSQGESKALTEMAFEAASKAHRWRERAVKVIDNIGK